MNVKTRCKVRREIIRAINTLKLEMDKRFDRVAVLQTRGDNLKAAGNYEQWEAYNERVAKHYQALEGMTFRYAWLNAALLKIGRVRTDNG